MMPVTRLGDRAVAYVVCGEHIVFVGGHVRRAAISTFANGRPIARFGDTVQYGCGRVGQITQRVARRTYVQARRAALYNSGVTGPGIVRGWIIQGSPDTFAG
jgi:uncharacterized Zn-binding protein involved in type VI secretion